jgi:hypothetical protein
LRSATAQPQPRASRLSLPRPHRGGRAWLLPP